MTYDIEDTWTCRSCGDDVPVSEAECPNCGAMEGETDVDRTIRRAEDAAADAELEIARLTAQNERMRAAIHRIATAAPIEDLVEAIETALTTTTQDTHPEYSIRLTFPDAEALEYALAYIGDGNAPVMPTYGIAVVGHQSFQLWDQYPAALLAARLPEEPPFT